MIVDPKDVEALVLGLPGGAAFKESWRVNPVGRREVAEYVVSRLWEDLPAVLDAGTTGFEVVNALARKRADGTKHVHTNNLAALASAIRFQMPCTLVGGPV